MENTEFPRAISSFFMAKQRKRVTSSLFPLGHLALAVITEGAAYLTPISNLLTWQEQLLGKDRAGAGQ